MLFRSAGLVAQCFDGLSKVFGRPGRVVVGIRFARCAGVVGDPAGSRIVALREDRSGRHLGCFRQFPRDCKVLRTARRSAGRNDPPGAPFPALNGPRGGQGNPRGVGEGEHDAGGGPSGGGGPGAGETRGTRGTRSGPGRSAAIRTTVTYFIA